MDIRIRFIDMSSISIISSCIHSRSASNWYRYSLFGFDTARYRYRCAPGDAMKLDKSSIVPIFLATNNEYNQTFVAPQHCLTSFCRPTNKHKSLKRLWLPIELFFEWIYWTILLINWLDNYWITIGQLIQSQITPHFLTATTWQSRDNDKELNNQSHDL